MYFGSAWVQPEFFFEELRPASGRSTEEIVDSISSF